MDVDEIEKCLAERDHESVSTYLEGLEPILRESDTTPHWTILASDGHRYVVKDPDNQQEKNAARDAPGFPLKILPTELVCGRLGQLFSPPICPPVAVVNISTELASKCRATRRDRPIAHGPSFGSQVVDGALDSKSEECRDGNCLERIAPDLAARLTVFHLWLNAMDPGALISADGKIALSIDHGFFLTGPQWDPHALKGMVKSPIDLLSRRWQVDFWRDDSFFREPLVELMGLSEDAIVSQFADIPHEWRTTPEFMAQVASYVLCRRHLVKSVVATLCQ